jgi:hypothetical protein
VTGSGQESLFQEQVGWSGALSGVGEFSPDATNPESKPLVEGSLGSAAGLLPWEPLQVRFSEPLRPSEALGRLSLRSGGSSVAVAWGAMKEAGDGSVSGLVGYRQGWDVEDGATALVLKDGFRDPAMNAGVGFEKNFLSVLVPAPKEGFAWGDGQQVLWGSAEAASGAECEGKACLVVGPFEVAPCGVPASGAALRLPALPAGAKVKLRYRVFQSQPGGGLMEGASGPALLTVEVARPGKQVSSSELSTPLVDKASTDSLLPYVSSWSTALVPVPEGSGEVGLALRAGGLGGTKACSGSAVNKNVPAVARVLVGAVSSEAP